MQQAVRAALSGVDDSSLTEIYPANTRQVSPFDRKVASYTMNAMSRSNSRGLNKQNQPSLKPALQKSTDSWMSKKMQTPTRSTDGAPNLRGLSGRFSEYDQCIGNLLSEVDEKQSRLDSMLAVIDKHNFVMNKFLQTHDVDLVRQFFTNTVLTPTETAHIVAKANLVVHQKKMAASTQSRTSVSPYRRGTMGEKRTPTRGTKSNNKARIGGLNTSVSSHNVMTPTRSERLVPAEI